MTLPLEPNGGLDLRIVGPGEGQRIDLAAGDFVHLKVTSKHSEGRFTLFEMVEQPDHPGVPLHVHETHDELWYILDGTLQLRIGDRTYSAETGSTYFVPRGVPHGFRTEGTRPSRFLGLFTPGGFEGWFIERTELLRAGQATPEAMARLAARYDMRLVEPLPSTMASD